MSYAVLPYVESLVYQGAPGVQGRDGCAAAVIEGFLEEAAFELNWKGHFHFLDRRIMVAVKGQRQTDMQGASS